MNTTDKDNENKPAIVPGKKNEEDIAKKKKEDYLRHPGKIEDYPAQEDVPGHSIAPDNDKKDA